MKRKMYAVVINEVNIANAKAFYSAIFEERSKAEKFAKDTSYYDGQNIIEEVTIERTTTERRYWCHECGSNDTPCDCENKERRNNNE